MGELFVVGVFGAIFGSFLNALLFRFKTGTTVFQGRSRCMRCGHTLRAVDLVPVLSFLFLQGKCRYCRTSISWQYPAVELGAAALSVLTWIYAGGEPTVYLFAFLVHLILLFIFVYDLRHTIIPTSALILLNALAVVYLIYSQPPYYDLIAGVILALPLFLFSLLSRGRAMGWADAPLQLALGTFLGFSMGLTALMFAFWGGALVGIGLLALAKGYRMKSEVPFAPFLILGAWVTHFLNVDLFPLLPLLLP